MNSEKLKQIILSFFVFVFSLAFAIYGVNWFSGILGGLIYERSVAAALSISDPVIANDLSSKNEAKNDSENNAINARALISINNKGEILFSKNEEEKLPIASLTKLMTALLVLENYNLEKNVKISSLAASQSGEQGDIEKGEVLSVENLLYIMLIESSNKAAFALSEILGKDEFVKLMNLRARELGLENTHFKDSTGLDPLSYSTAGDLAKLSAYLFDNYPLFSKIVSLKEFNLYLPNGRFHHKLINTNRLLGQLPGVVGGKTGWTSFSKGCFMVIQKDPQSKDYLIHVILGAEDRLAEMEKLIDFINVFYKG